MMKSDLYPFLTDIERDLDNPFSNPKGPWWGLGEDARNKSINATITGFDKKLESSSADDLAAYSEGLKSHLVRALGFSEDALLSDYEKVIIYCHKNLSFAFFALIVRAYYRKQLPFNAFDYAANAGIDDTTVLFPTVSEAADNWAIHFVPSIRELLNGSVPLKSTRKSENKYDLLADYPRAKVFLKRAQKAGYLNDDYSLCISRADASIIAYTIAHEVNIVKVCKYFEAFWNISDLSNTHKQVKERYDKNRTRKILQTLLRKPVDGIRGDTVDTNKVESYMYKYM